MIRSKIVGNFGEHYAAIGLMDHYGEECLVDFVDSAGIDLVTYLPDRTIIGVSVKTRDVSLKPNPSIKLDRKDIEYCWSESIRRNAKPCFAFVVVHNKGLDMKIVSLEDLLCETGKKDYFQPDPEDPNRMSFGLSSLSVPISPTARTSWTEMKFTMLAKSLRDTTI